MGQGSDVWYDCSLVSQPGHLEDKHIHVHVSKIRIKKRQNWEIGIPLRSSRKYPHLPNERDFFKDLSSPPNSLEIPLLVLQDPRPQEIIIPSVGLELNILLRVWQHAKSPVDYC